MRVLSMVETYSVSGTGKPVIEFACQAARSDLGLPKVEVTILTFTREQPETDFTRTVRAAGIGIEIVTERNRWDSGILRQLRSAVTRLEPDVLWTNGTKSHFLVKAAGLNRNIRWIAFHHGYTATDWLARTYNQLDRWSLRSADLVVTVCRPFADQLERRNGVARGRIRVQHMPVRPAPPVSESELAGLRRQLGLGGERVLLSVGRLSREKGHADFLRALAHVREMEPALSFRALLVGDGPERRPLEALCSQLRLADVVWFLGHQREVRPYYALADLFVLPSHSEGSPNVLLEAMASNVPVVATSVGGVPEMAQAGVEALLVPKADPSALAREILRALKDPALAAGLVRSARAVVDRHSPEDFFRSMRAVLQER
jgi:glycosyltransferase involved in cell wall biosynthesis